MTQSRLRVLHVIPSVALSYGGPSYAMGEIERSLSQSGIDVTTVTSDDNGNGKRLRVPVGQPVRENGATRWYFRRSSQFYKCSLGMARWLRSNIAAYDIVHVHGLFSFAPVVAATLARRARVPYVIRPFGVLARYGMTQRRPLLKKLSFATLEKPLLAGASAVQFTSEEERREAEQLCPGIMSTVIPLGISTDARPPISAQPRKSGSTILFLSRIDPKKNIEGLLKAFAALRRKGRDVRLLIAGNGDARYVQKLKSLAATLAGAENVEWLGYVEGAAKQALLGRADVFVLPSYSENFGIAVVEAMAAGLPCVVSGQVAIQEEITAFGAGIVVGTDAQSISQGIEQLLDDPGKLARMSEAARHLVASRFSAARMASDLEALYFRIAGTSQQGEIAVAARGIARERIANR